MIALKKRRVIPSIVMAFGMMAAVVCGFASNKAKAYAHIDRQAASEVLTPKQIIAIEIDQFEGHTVNPNDGGPGIPSKFGILSGKGSGLSPRQVRALNDDGATNFYDKRFMQPIEAAHLPNPMPFLTFDTAIRTGSIPRALNMAAESSNDKQLYLENSARYYNHLLYKRAVEKRPYPAWVKKAWDRRQVALAAYTGADTTDPLIRIGNSRSAPKFTLLPFFKQGVQTLDQAQPAPTVIAANDTVASPPVAQAQAVAAVPTVPSIGKSNIILLGLLSSIIGGPLSTSLIPSFLSRLVKRRPKTLQQDPPKSAPPLSRLFQDMVPPAAVLPQQISQPQLAGFSAREQAAFASVFGQNAARAITSDNTKWQVECPSPTQSAKAHVVVENQKVTVHGDDGIEMSLRYAAQAWGDCHVSNADKDSLRKIELVAQKLVDRGELPAGFTIHGLRVFHPNVLPSRPVTSKAVLGQGRASSYMLKPKPA